MSLFDKFEPFLARYDQTSGLAVNPFGVVFDEVISPTRGVVQGREVLLAGTNNYLGLTYDPDLKAAASRAIEARGTGTTGSRMANGSYGDHRALEAALADWYEAPAAVAFTTGFQANLAVIPTLAGRRDLLVIDADCHASIYDACKLSDAGLVRFRHNDPRDLDAKLAAKRAEVTGDVLVVIEGLYSMFGDTAPVAEMLDVCRRHGAMLYVDEAHSLGTYGAQGRGCAEAEGVLEEVDFVAGTFSKSLATIGGFCVSRHAVFDRLRPLMRAYTFTASATPADVAVATAAVPRARDGHALREALHARAARLHGGLTELGFELCAPPSPIIAVRVGSDLEGLFAWTNLLEGGVYANLAVPPATPKGACLIRLSVSAAHTDEDVTRILDAFEALARTMAATRAAAE